LKLSTKAIKSFSESGFFLIFKFTFNIIIIAIYILALTKFIELGYIFLIILVSIIYIVIVLLLNRFLIKKLIEKKFDKKYNKFLVFRRKRFLKKYFSKIFDNQKYLKDNLIIFLLSILFFIILFLVSLPFIVSIGGFKIILLVLFFSLIFTIIFAFNIIVPFFIFSEFHYYNQKSDSILKD